MRVRAQLPAPLANSALFHVFVRLTTLRFPVSYTKQITIQLQLFAVNVSIKALPPSLPLQQRRLERKNI